MNFPKVLETKGNPFLHMKLERTHRSFPKFPESLYRKSQNIYVNILPDRYLTCRSSGTIFSDPQGNKAHRSVQILKESSAWELKMFTFLDAAKIKV